MRWIIDFLSNMEARRWRAVLATALLLGAMIALFAVGKSLPFELRESALGGLAATPAACAYCESCLNRG